MLGGAGAEPNVAAAQLQWPGALPPPPPGATRGRRLFRSSFLSATTAEGGITHWSHAVLGSVLRFCTNGTLQGPSPYLPNIERAKKGLAPAAGAPGSNHISILFSQSISLFFSWGYALSSHLDPFLFFTHLCARTHTHLSCYLLSGDKLSGSCIGSACFLPK